MTVRNVQSIIFNPVNGGVQAGGISDPKSNPLQDFTTLLASEITNEDPNNPISSTDMVTQYAEVNAAVGMSQLFQTSQTYEQAQTASDLLGQTVTLSDPTTHRRVTGKVKAIDFSGDMPRINIADAFYPLSSVTLVD